jgi:hypothetical protein
MSSEADAEVTNTLSRNNTISDVGSSLMQQIGTQYHLKVSFQQILAKNELKSIKEENNKKEEIMNRKKQKIINDSILGALIPRNTG